MLEEVEDERDQVRARLEDEQLDHAETQAELLNAKLELDRLRGVLARAGRVDQSRARSGGGAITRIVRRAT